MKRQKNKVYIWGFQKKKKISTKNLPKWELRLCMYMFPLLANVLLQFSKSHLYGLSPVWMLVCSWNVTLVAKPLPQNSQLNGFWEFSVWNIVMWVFILDFGTSFPHVTHGNFSWTVLMCLFRYGWSLVLKSQDSYWHWSITFSDSLHFLLFKWDFRWA